MQRKESRPTVPVARMPRETCKVPGYEYLTPRGFGLECAALCREGRLGEVKIMLDRAIDAGQLGDICEAVRRGAR